jgi:hypothetical protein
MSTLDGGSASGIPTTTESISVLEEIIVSVQKQVQDITGTLYNAEYVLPYANLAFIEMVKTDPASYPVTKVFELVAGTIQTLDTAEISILGVVCNMTNKVTESDTVVAMTREKIDQLIPTWHTFTANKVVKYVVLDKADQNHFHVFPPQPIHTDQGLKMIFSEIPPYVYESDDSFPFEASYKLPCINYILYLILREETTIPNALNKANMCLAQFFRQMGVTQTPAK